jgi:16S rRNA (cytosine1402-N4)-methyltransferase
MSHVSVLLQEVLEIFQPLALRFFLDATLGAGGHSEALLKAHPELQRLTGIDQDPVARKIAVERLAAWPDKVQILPVNFAQLPTLGLSELDGILFDLGVSSMQFDQPEKGFSFMQEGPLDMRMDPSGPLTAAEIVNEWPEKELGRIFREYGEEKRWRRAAAAIVQARKASPLKTTSELACVLRNALPEYQKKGIHPATLIFQALRICVNDELNVLQKTIPAAISALKSEGRLAVISFHSLEDRIVKQAMQYAASDKESSSGIGGIFLDKEPTVRILTKKPIIPSPAEVESNPRSRSAKLRAIEKL